MENLFKGCALNALGPDDGHYEEYPLHGMTAAAKVELALGLHVVFGAIVEHVMKASTFERALYRPMMAEEMQVLHMHPVQEEDGSADYDFHRLTLFDQQGMVSYVYIVADVVMKDQKKDRLTAAYRLRAISVPMPIVTPESGWCRERGNWYFLSDAPTGFNRAAAGTA